MFCSQKTVMKKKMFVFDPVTVCNVPQCGFKDVDPAGGDDKQDIYTRLLSAHVEGWVITAPPPPPPPARGTRGWGPPQRRPLQVSPGCALGLLSVGRGSVLYRRGKYLEAISGKSVRSSAFWPRQEALERPGQGLDTSVAPASLCVTPPRRPAAGQAGSVVGS